MRKNWATLFGITAAVAVTTAVRAMPISGTIEMGGEANLNTSDMGSATSIASWPLVYVVADSGAFSSIPGLPAFTTVNMNSTQWTFAPAPGVPMDNLWNVGGFQFNFQSDTVSQSATSLTIIGYGNIISTVAGSGYDQTAFEWELSAETPTTGGNVQFTFSATAEPNSNGLPVPDGGLTAAFLGLALVGIEGLRRKLGKA